MHPALEAFINEYKKLLKTTNELYESTQERFVEIQQEIRNSGVNDELLQDLYTISKKLFQTGYFLMESHLKVNNIRANYCEEDQKEIDKYEAIEDKINKLIISIISYKQSFGKSNSNDLNV